LEKLLDFGYLSFEFVWYLMLGIWNLKKGASKKEILLPPN